MKKKLLTLVLSAVLCLGMSTTVLASPSTSQSASGAYATVGGQQVEIGVSSMLDVNEAQAEAMTAALYSKFENVDWSAMTEEEMIEFNNEVYTSFIQETIGVTVAGVELTDFVDLKNTTGADLSAGVSITFPATGISAGDSIIVIHLTDAGEWEHIPAVAGDGVITGTFTSLSPVYYFKVTGLEATGVAGGHTHSYAETVVEPTATTWGYTMYNCACGDNYVSDYVAPLGSTATATSPKTADSAMSAVVTMVALASVAGVVVVSRRKACVR